MRLSEFIEDHVLTDPEWRAAYDAADATRAAARMLLRARQEAGLSQTELAERSGTAQAVISRIERGIVSPSLDTLSKIAKGLGMRPLITLRPIRGDRTRVTEKKGAVPGKGLVPKNPPPSAVSDKSNRTKTSPRQWKG